MCIEVEKGRERRLRQWYGSEVGRGIEADRGRRRVGLQGNEGKGKDMVGLMRVKREDCKVSPIWREGVFCKDTKETCYSYEEYGKSLHWGKLRVRKFKSTKERRCEDCRRKHINMQVHHLTYENIGNEKMEDLKVLCPNCHAEAHGKTMKLTHGNNFWEGDYFGIQSVDSILDRLAYV